MNLRETIDIFLADSELRLARRVLLRAALAAEEQAAATVEFVCERVDKCGLSEELEPEVERLRRLRKGADLLAAALTNLSAEAHGRTSDPEEKERFNAAFDLSAAKTDAACLEVFRDRRSAASSARLVARALATKAEDIVLRRDVEEILWKRIDEATPYDASDTACFNARLAKCVRAKAEERHRLDKWVKEAEEEAEAYESLDALMRRQSEILEKIGVGAAFAAKVDVAEEVVTGLSSISDKLGEPLVASEADEARASMWIDAFLECVAEVDVESLPDAERAELRELLEILSERTEALDERGA